MKQKKLFFVCVCFLCATSLYAMDVEILFSTPSLFGLTCGTSPLLNMTEDYENAEKSFAYSIQSYGNICHAPFREDITIAWSGGMNFYTQGYTDSSRRAFMLGVTGGIGMFLNYWNSYTRQKNWEVLPLTGLSFFLYPIYEFPIIRINGEPFWKWKMALETGINITVCSVSLYPYFRGMCMFVKDSDSVGAAIDIGVLVGIYL